MCDFPFYSEITSNGEWTLHKFLNSRNIEIPSANFFSYEISKLRMTSRYGLYRDGCYEMKDGGNCYYNIILRTENEASKFCFRRRFILYNMLLNYSLLFHCTSRKHDNYHKRTRRKTLQCVLSHATVRVAHTCITYYVHIRRTADACGIRVRHQ